MISALMLSACLGCAPAKPDYDAVYVAGKCSGLAHLSEKLNATLVILNTIDFIDTFDKTNPLYISILWQRYGEGRGYVFGVYKTNSHQSINEVQAIMAVEWKKNQCDKINFMSIPPIKAASLNIP